MLICNNCGKTNAPGVSICAHCRMQGGFTPGGKPESPEGKDTPEDQTRQCVNCGSHVGIMLSRCPACRFPLKPLSARQADRTFVFGSLKAG